MNGESGNQEEGYQVSRRTGWMCKRHKGTLLRRSGYAGQARAQEHKCIRHKSTSKKEKVKKMETCTIASHLEIVEGNRGDYEGLSRYHYRGESLGPYVRIFAMRGRFATASRAGTAGVIVYTMPTVALELRNVALGGMLEGLDRQARIAIVNRNIRRISRVIIEPRFRGLGLAVRIVKETMPKMDVPMVESLAVMGQVNPFFEKAGMVRYDGGMPERCVRLIEALSAAGIEEEELNNPKSVQRKMEGLGRRAADFIEREIHNFLQSYGKRRYMQGGIERTRYVLSKLTDRPVYYFWRNPNLQLTI